MGYNQTTFKVRLHILITNPFRFEHCVGFWDCSVLALVHRPMETNVDNLKTPFKVENACINVLW